MRTGFVSGKMGLNEFGQFAISVAINDGANYEEHLLQPTARPHSEVIDRAFKSIQSQVGERNNGL